MNFFKKIVSSVYSPEFYAEIPNSSLSSAIKYFFLLILLVTALTFTKSIPEFLFGFSKDIKTSMTQVTESYPDSLELVVKSGKVTSNVKEPYFLTDKSGSNFLVIDTKTAYSADKFESYKAPVWVTSDTIFYKGEDSQIKSQSLAQIGDVTVNKNFVNSIASKVTPWIPYFGPLMLLISMIFLTLFYSFRLVYALFLALLVMLLAKIYKKKLNYKDSYKVSIYAMTLPFIIDDIKLFAGWNGFPLMFTVISLLVVAINFVGLKGSKK